MKKKVALIAVAALMTLAGCNPETPSSSSSSKPTSEQSSAKSESTSTKSSESSSVKEKVALGTPVVTVSTEVSGQVEWEEVEHADYYLVFVNGSTEGIETVATSFKAPLLDDSITAQIRVQAVAEADNENYKSGELSAAVTVTHTANEHDSWDKDGFKSEWTPSSATLDTLNEGLDLKKGQSMAIVKQLSKDKPYLAVTMRDFEGQEDGETGAKVRLTVDGKTVKAINYDTEEITLDKNCGRDTLGIYDLGSLNIDYSKPHVLRIAEVSSYSNHCVIIGAEFQDKAMEQVFAVATKQNYWGRNYTDNWSGEMGPKDGVEKPQTIADDSSWIKVGACENINEGLKLQKEASVTKLVSVTADNCYLTIAVRNFGGADEDFAGGVMVNGALINAIGDADNYFTKKTSATYFEGGEDGCVVATMRTYDLSSYIGKSVWLTIANMKCYAIGGNEDLVIGSVSFAGKRAVKENATFDASSVSSFEGTSSLMLAGPWTIYNEGISFRSQDFASGISETLDLSEVASGKYAYVQTYWRSVVDDNVSGTFQTMVNGSLKNTYKYLTRDKSDNFAVVGIDLSGEIGKVANYSIHIPSRNNRMVLSKIEYVISDTAIEEGKLSYAAKEDEKDVSYSNGEFTWGHNYKTNWGGEMGDDNLKYGTILESGWTADGDTNDFNEGLKLAHGTSISKTLTIDEKHATMAFGARTFGNDFKGEVTLKEGDKEAVKLKAIGYDTEYFTKNGAVTKLSEVSDDCQNAVMYVYDLSAYLNKEVTLSIKNLAGEIVGDDKDADGYDDRLVLSSIGFTSILKVTESMTWDASTIKQLNDNTALQAIPVGAYSIYNEGINFRTQDLASGFTRSFDFSDAALSGKTVKVKFGLRNFSSEGEDISLQLLLNGALAETKSVHIGENVTELEFDMSQLAGIQAGANVNLGVHIPSRTYRIVLTGLSVTIE